MGDPITTTALMVGGGQLGAGILGSASEGKYKWGEGLPDWLKSSITKQAKMPTEAYQQMLFGQGKSALGKQMQGLSQQLQEQYARRGLTGSGLEMSNMNKLGQAELEQLLGLQSQSALQANQMKQSALGMALGVPSQYEPSFGEKFAPLLMDIFSGAGKGLAEYWKTPTGTSGSSSFMPSSTGYGGVGGTMNSEEYSNLLKSIFGG